MKYLLLIDDNKKKTLKQFFIPPKTEQALEKISAQYDKNYNENIEDKLFNINKEEINYCVDLMGKVMKGYGHYEFENTKRNYNIVKNILSFAINCYEDLFFGKHYIFRKNYEILLDKILNLEYIARKKHY